MLPVRGLNAGCAHNRLEGGMFTNTFLLSERLTACEKVAVGGER